VTWTFSANPGNESGETWFFYGSVGTSNAAGSATEQEIQDWGNICNWYSNKTSAPPEIVTATGAPDGLNRRATRLPPDDAVVHIYSNVNTLNVGPVIVKNAYFWASAWFLEASTLTATSSAHDSAGGVVFNDDSVVLLDATINGGATFNEDSACSLGAVVNDGAVLNDDALLGEGGTINDSAVFNDESGVNDGTVNGGAVFNNDSFHFGTLAVVNGGATFNDNSRNNFSTVNGGATFNDNSVFSVGRVNDGAVFNDAACSESSRGLFFNFLRPQDGCLRKFVAHPSDVPTCNGTAPDGCANAADTCGCG